MALANESNAMPAGRQPIIRQQEVDDDDDFFPAVPAAAAAAAPSGLAASASGAENATPDEQPASDEEVEEKEQQQPEGSGKGPACRVVWDSSGRKGGSGGAAAPPPAAADASSDAARLKEEGNALIKTGNYEEAAKTYSKAIAACLEAATAGCTDGSASGASDGDRAGSGKGAPAEVVAPDDGLLATLHSNRAQAYLRLRRYGDSLSDAQLAHRLAPAWPKPLARLAEAHLALGAWVAAAGAAKAGERLSKTDSEGRTPFSPLLDRIAVAAAAGGSLAGYDGTQLEVRSAGEDAWLGRPAPHVPELDGPEDEDALLPATTLQALPAPGAAGAGTSDSGSRGGSLALAAAGVGGAGPAAAQLSGDALASWDYRLAAAAAARRRTSFRSIKEAVAAARDGDRILLRRGVHNGMGESITLRRRVLIEGEGALGEAVIDQRANAPTFRIQRGGVVLRNIDLDQTGFREALLVTGTADVAPLIDGCRLRCSGDDAVNVSGAAAPRLRGCTIGAKKCGLRAFGSAAPLLERCVLESCGEQGVKAMERARPSLVRCGISDCGEEGALAMDAARLALRDCRISGCKGPAVDVSGGAQLALSGGSAEGCVGGVWLWERARAELLAAVLSGGPSHALLVDGQAAPTVRDSTIKGSVHSTEAGWGGILHPSNKILDPDQPTDFPEEDGPFRFVPDRFRRKQ